MRLPDRLLVVTDRAQTRRPLPDVVAEALKSGARWVWLRDRDLPQTARVAVAASLQALTREAGAALIVGGDAMLAAAVKADGVQLSARGDIAQARRLLGRSSLIGVSAHSPHECEAAAQAGADYACLSPIYATDSKPGYGPALGPAVLTQAAHFLPIVALGGITPDRVAACRDAGAVAVAVMGGIMRTADVAGAVRAFRQALTENSADRHPPRP